jgi:hypothetical protein
MAIFRHVMSGVTPGETWSCTLHTTGAGTLASAQTAFSGAVGAFWTGELDSIVTADVSVTEVSTASIDAGTGHQISRLIDDVSLPGVAAGEMLPFQCASGVSWRTAMATRSGRGRMYLPPLAVSTLDTGRLSSAAVSTIIDAVGQLTDSLDGGGLALVLLNRTTLATTAVTSVDVGNVIDTQRRRRNKLVEVRVSSPVP